MNTILRHTVVLIVAYFAAWTAAYAGAFLSRGDDLNFTYFFEYLHLAWTFRGLELPAFIWFFSIIIFLPLAGLMLFLLRKSTRRKNES